MARFVFTSCDFVDRSAGPVSTTIHEITKKKFDRVLSVTSAARPCLKQIYLRESATNSRLQELAHRPGSDSVPQGSCDYVFPSRDKRVLPA